MPLLSCFLQPLNLCHRSWSGASHCERILFSLSVHSFFHRLSSANGEGRGKIASVRNRPGISSFVSGSHPYRANARRMRLSSSLAGCAEAALDPGVGGPADELFLDAGLSDRWPVISSSVTAGAAPSSAIALWRTLYQDWKRVVRVLLYCTRKTAHPNDEKYASLHSLATALSVVIFLLLRVRKHTH